MKLFARKRASIDLSRKKSGISLASLGSFGIGIIVVIIAVFSSLLALHYYRLANELKKATAQHPASSANADPVTQAISAVERHILLPQGERPQVARVTDLSQLSNIPFFGNALVGDEVLVYCKSSLSILYSPAREKVIEVSRQLVAGSCSQ